MGGAYVLPVGTRVRLATRKRRGWRIWKTRRELTFASCYSDKNGMLTFEEQDFLVAVDKRLVIRSDELPANN